MAVSQAQKGKIYIYIYIYIYIFVTESAERVEYDNWVPSGGQVRDAFDRVGTWTEEKQTVKQKVR